ncbi:N-glycosylase [candidate division MSBL1 archaeon SCGC-AAA382C18]|uniref:8-oxoguanine DNA glycosylase/AP lyase n=1 Tax=candidate division MSBL1 archaeon SCGC-AAA382C18 TaxID=1698281 RepID=A0A133VKA5_9EURY|nr:N-glycosylase [candidate division MSBL1 archaeon SCGC-AAA382C18]
MKTISSKLEELMNSEVSEVIQKRMEEFEKVGGEGNNRWFSELCFCILTANSTAKLGIEIQNDLGFEGFANLPVSELTEKLQEAGHRFYRTRGEYIVEAREYSDSIKDIVKEFSDSREARKWVVDNVKGIGFKEGSHFLRNIGYRDLMILDRHVLRVADRWGVIDEIPNTLTKKRYLSIEKEIEKLSNRMGLPLGEIDLYIWYMDTEKVLK